jgi:hypothetical protein
VLLCCSLSIANKNDVWLKYDSTQLAESLPHEQLAHNGTNIPKAWIVYSRRGRKGNSGWRLLEWQWHVMGVRDSAHDISPIKGVSKRGSTHLGIWHYSRIG